MECSTYPENLLENVLELDAELVVLLDLQNFLQLKRTKKGLLFHSEVFTVHKWH
jgi:hypothetical protein